MSFFRHREIFQSDVMRVVRERFTRRSRPHRLDEFPAGYSLAVCSPAWPASALPSVDHSALQSSCRSILFHRAAHSVLSVCLNSGAHSSHALPLRAHTYPFTQCAPNVKLTYGLYFPKVERHLSTPPPVDNSPDAAIFIAFRGRFRPSTLTWMSAIPTECLILT